MKMRMTAIIMQQKFPGNILTSNQNEHNEVHQMEVFYMKKGYESRILTASKHENQNWRYLDTWIYGTTSLLIAALMMIILKYFHKL